MDYHGPTMQAALRECTRLGIRWEDLSPAELRRKLNARTGQHISDSEEQEVAAAQWLMVMRAMPAHHE